MVCPLSVGLWRFVDIAWWTSAEKELTSWLSAYAVLLYVVLILVFLSHMVSGEGSGIWLYRFLIIAFSVCMFSSIFFFFFFYEWCDLL